MFTSRFRGKSFGEILDANNGAGMGFDLLRIGLSVLILLSHTSGITGNRGITSGILAWIFHVTPDIQHSLTAAAAGVANGDAVAVKGLGRPITLSHVPMFFALSGFLVTGSAFRTRNVGRFLGLRVLRILPALFVEVMLSAVLLGAIFTALPLSEYFSSAGFFSYFGNIIGDIHFTLPGVFVGTSMSPNVNSNLWTLPSEFQCYVMLSVIMIVGLLSYPRVLSVIFLICTVALLIANMFYGYFVTSVQLGSDVNVYYFVVGMLAYLWRNKIIYHEGILLLCVAICYPLMMFTNTVFVYPILLVYITIFIGLTPFPQSKLLKSGDYSYGIYLYGYPVTQAVVAAIPSIRGNFLAVALLSLLLTGAFSYFSWHGIEKHFLKLKRFLSPRSSQIAKSLHPDETAIATVPAAKST
jgi:peptidoglycan/LPS O-acetylase OafA/YrhL